MSPQRGEKQKTPESIPGWDTIYFLELKEQSFGKGSETIIKTLVRFRREGKKRIAKVVAAITKEGFLLIIVGALSQSHGSLLKEGLRSFGVEEGEIVWKGGGFFRVSSDEILEQESIVGESCPFGRLIPPVRAVFIEELKKSIASYE
jgi:hypothetical protein